MTLLTQRPSVLLLHSFSLRLQNEDPAFIRDFVQAHLSFRHELHLPGQFQPITIGNTNEETLRCYRRLSYSCHIPHFALEDTATDLPGNSHAAVREIGAFEPPSATKFTRDQNSPGPRSLCQVTSSCLLTFFLPEESGSRRHDTELLTAPSVFWALLAVNCTRSRSSGSASYYPHDTPGGPVAQFFRAIHGGLQTQRTDGQEILEALQTQLAELDDQSLFDDKDYSKSYLYHWAVQVCDTLCQSISSTIRFMAKSREDFENIKTGVSSSEQAALEIWSARCARKVQALEELREDFLSCKQDVQERVSSDLWIK